MCPHDKETVNRIYNLYAGLGITMISYLAVALYSDFTFIYS